MTVRFGFFFGFLLSVLSPLTFAMSLEELEGSVPSLISKASIDYVEMKHNDDTKSYADQFKKALRDDFVLPSISFDPNSSFEFSLKAKNSASHRDQFIDIEDKESHTGPVSNLNTQEDQDSKHIQSYASYKCKQEKAQLSASSLNVSLNLEDMVEDIMGGLTKMEGDIKNSISNQVSQTFASLSSYFSPEYAFEMIFRAYKSELSMRKCNFCKDTNKLGCGGVFLLAEAYKAPVDAAQKKQITDGIAGDKELQKDSGSAIDTSTGTACTTASALSTPSGIHFAEKTRNKSISKGVKKEMVKLTDAEIDSIAMETCTVTSDRAITDKINKALSVLIGSVEMKTRTQKACVDENKKDIVIIDKRLNLQEEQGKIFFSSINRKIDAVNKNTQKLTGSVMDSVVNAEALFYGKPKANDTGYGKAISKLLKDTESLEADSVGNVSFNKNRALDFILQEDSSSNAKRTASDLVESLAYLLRFGDYYKLQASDENAMSVLFLKPDEADTVEFAKDDIENLRFQFEQDVDFYTGRIWTELSKKMPDDSSVYTCTGFETKIPDEVRKCFLTEQVNRYQDQRSPDTCSCSSFGFSQDLTPPLIPFIDHLKGEVDPDGVFETYQFTTSDSYEKRYRYYLKNRLLDYLEQMKINTLNMKAKVDIRLTVLPLQEQEEIKRLFKTVTGIFK